MSYVWLINTLGGISGQWSRHIERDLLTPPLPPDVSHLTSRFRLNRKTTCPNPPLPEDAENVDDQGKVEAEEAESESGLDEEANVDDDVFVVPEPAEPDTHPSTLPAHLREMSYEDVKSDLTYEDLTEHEKQIYRYLKVKTTKGIPYILQYRNGWGKGGVDEHGQITRKQPKTPAFKSKAALKTSSLV